MAKQPTRDTTRAKKTAAKPVYGNVVHGKAFSQLHYAVMHDDTQAMLKATGKSCGGKAPMLWDQQPDGSWLVCYLQPDCEYGPWHRVTGK